MKNNLSKLIILLPIFLFAFNISCKSQNPGLSLIDEKPKYVLIRNISTSNPTYYENGDDYKAGHVYRIVESSFEIYNSIYVEKIIFDIEEIPSTISWSKKLKTEELYQFLKLGEETNPILFGEWLNPNSFTLKIGANTLKIKIREVNFKDVELVFVSM